MLQYVQMYFFTSTNAVLCLLLFIYVLKLDSYQSQILVQINLWTLNPRNMDTNSM